jgi:hypothetical protein
MQGQQRLTQPRALAARQLPEPCLRSLLENAPLVAQQLRDALPSTFDPGAPMTARCFHRTGPVGNTIRGPRTNRRERKAKRLRPVEHDVREREHIGRPLKQLVRQPAAGHLLPRRRQSRLACARFSQQLVHPD